jgi:ribosomal protection tetracycline resistance protein
VRFRLEVELGSMPHAFTRTVEETVRETLAQGLHGWGVTDCVVTLTHSGYWARQSHSHGTFDASMSSTAGDFRHLTPLVVMSALRAAGTIVLEPVHAFHIEVPADLFRPVLAALTKAGATPEPPELRDPVCELRGRIPTAAIHAFERRLPGMSRGEGVMETTFAGYEPVRGAVPSRARTDHNPLDRKEYLLHVQRRV